MMRNRTFDTCNNGRTKIVLLATVLAFSVCSLAMGQTKNAGKEVGVFFPGELNYAVWSGGAFPNGFQAISYDFPMVSLLPNVPLLNWVSGTKPMNKNGSVNKRGTVQYLGFEAQTDGANAILGVDYVAVNQSWKAKGLKDYAKVSLGPDIFVPFQGNASSLGALLRAGGGLVWVFKGRKSSSVEFGLDAAYDYGLFSVSGSIYTYSGLEIGLSFGSGAIGPAPTFQPKLQ